MKRYLFLSLLLAGCEPPPLEEGPADPPPAEEKAPMPHKNRLAKEKSPYLLQHAANPVDWYPWGEEAFEKAKKEDKPIFLSVGYSTCHWCHVMERESFENEEIAKILNEKYVSIKVDREERPDVDEIYMEAVQAMNNGSGGWPMSVFLTPDREPFFAGTYFPPDDRFGRPGFGSLLGRISELWKTQRAEVTKQGKMLVDYLAETGQAAAAKELSPKLVAGATRQLLSRYDSEYGGFGGAPKFPPSMVLGFLLRVAAADGPASTATKHTFDMMARGGMYDQIGGGFARYSTDEMWLIPHFEKMLYDNAQLARAYAESFVVTGDAYHARIAREILDYVRREMTAPEGAFWSATDADSEGEEGKFFAWKPEEIVAVLGKDEGAAFCEYYGVTKDGNFEHGSSALHVETFDVGKDRRFADARAKLYEARKKRVPPHLDDKILTSWNGLMISAFATASWALDEPAYLEAARKAARFLVDNVLVSGRLRRGWRQGVMSVGGFLDDYAYLSAALLDLYEASGELEWYVKARDLSAKMVELFSDPASPGFFTTGNDQEKLIARRKDVYDGAVPSGNSVAAMTLLRVSKFTSDPALRQRAVDTLSVFHERMEKLAPAQAEMLKAVAFVQAPPKEVVISGKPGSAHFAELARAARRAWPPNRVLAFATGSAEEEKEMPILVGRNPGDQAMAFVCVGETCLPPIRTVEELLRALK